VSWFTLVAKGVSVCLKGSLIIYIIINYTRFCIKLYDVTRGDDLSHASALSIFKLSGNILTLLKLEKSLLPVQSTVMFNKRYSYLNICNVCLRMMSYYDVEELYLKLRLIWHTVEVIWGAFVPNTNTTIQQISIKTFIMPTSAYCILTN
jgi:hypothetical protein